MSARERLAKGWALFTPRGHIFYDSVRRTRAQVMSYANANGAPGWNWKKYRNKGFYIDKVEIRSLTGGGNG